VVFGWVPEHPTVRRSVQAAISIFRRVSSPAMMRSLVWPFCVNGCLSSELEEYDFREVVSEMGSLRDFGTLEEGLDMMERVWKIRYQLQQESWDLARCFELRGTRLLLI
jgi:C6 transcription factor Pro1